MMIDYPTSMEPGKMKSINISQYSLCKIAILESVPSLSYFIVICVVIAYSKDKV